MTAKIAKSSGHAAPKSTVATLGVSLGALGVVYGDIGTSPLYALREAAKAAAGGGALSPAAAVAATSAIIWSLVVIVALKYALLILRADNRGEGGIMAMLAILHARAVQPGRSGLILLVAGLVGAALLYGDGAITPAVSVLSAVEGLKTDAPFLAPAVVPITICIIVGLFAAQRFGTAKIGRVFGPVMLLWFLAIALLGIGGIARAPHILVAFDPFIAIDFLRHAPFAVDAALLGAAFLAVTGGEAMYADLGHFGVGPIRLAWFALVLPCLLLNYLGQGALLLDNPSALASPFWKLAPGWAHYPLVAFATCATIIASQSIISGAFSLTRQAIQLGFLPRLRVLHTDAASIGQVYLPFVNTGLAIATITAVVTFGSSDALAGAYGIAVSLLMVITTLLAALIARQWGYALALVLAVNGAFLTIDLGFFVANSVKIFEGGWFPLAIAGGVALLMLTWRRGQQLVAAARACMRQSSDAFRADLKARPPLRPAGVAAFLTPSREGVPLSLSRLYALTGAIPEHIILLSIEILEIPAVAADDHVQLIAEDGYRRMILRYGFTEPVRVPAALDIAVAQGKLDAETVRDLVFYVGREAVIPSRAVLGMAYWREKLFAFMQRNAERPAAYFCIPPGRVIDVGTEIEI
ncbi:potassium transporter Kup [Sphingomonas glacialis]|nr:KUP/HAK/KT family potassium transporter [Sphingomonas glacialis]